jgi:hypothetical protein
VVSSRFLLIFILFNHLFYLFFISKNWTKYRGVNNSTILTHCAPITCARSDGVYFICSNSIFDSSNIYLLIKYLICWDKCINEPTIINVLIHDLDDWLVLIIFSFNLLAKVVVELAKSRLIEAAVLLHPSFITLDDIKGKEFYMYICWLASLNKFTNLDVFCLCHLKIIHVSQKVAT